MISPKVPLYPFFTRYVKQAGALSAPFAVPWHTKYGGVASGPEPELHFVKCG